MLNVAFRLQVEAAVTSRRYTALEVTVGGCGQLLCQIQIVHRDVWNALHNNFGPAELSDLERVSYLLPGDTTYANANANANAKANVNANANVQSVDKDDSGEELVSPKMSSPRAKLQHAKVGRCDRWCWLFALLSVGMAHSCSSTGSRNCIPEWFLKGGFGLTLPWF